jgi:hypothetical protein
VFGLDIYITAAEEVMKNPREGFSFFIWWAISSSSLSSGEIKEPRYLNCQVKWMVFPSVLNCFRMAWLLNQVSIEGFLVAIFVFREVSKF